MLSKLQLSKVGTFLMTQCMFLKGYENLEDRKEVREAAWSRPGWDQCVSRTGEIHGDLKKLNRFV